MSRLALHILVVLVALLQLVNGTSDAHSYHDSIVPQPSHGQLRPDDILLADDLSLFETDDSAVNVTRAGKKVVAYRGRDGRTHLFSIVGKLLITRSQIYVNSNRYSPWRVIGRDFAEDSTGSPTLATAVSVTTLTDGRLIVFARAMNNKLKFMWESSGLPCRWTTWHDLPGTLRSSPVAAMRKDGIVEVFGINEKQQLVYSAQKKRGEVLTWTDWKVLSSKYKFVSDELSLRTIGDTVFLFALNSKGLLLYTTRDLGDYSGWRDWSVVGKHVAGLKLRGAPQIAKDNTGALWVFTVSQDFYLAKIKFTPSTKKAESDDDHAHQVSDSEAGTWSPWEVTDHRFQYTPSLSENRDGRLVAVGVTLDNTTMVQFQVTLPESPSDVKGNLNAGTKGIHWSHWYPLLHGHASKPELSKNGNGELEIFVDPNVPGQQLLHSVQVDVNTGFMPFTPVAQLSHTKA